MPGQDDFNEFERKERELQAKHEHWALCEAQGLKCENCPEYIGDNGATGIRMNPYGEICKYVKK